MSRELDEVQKVFEKITPRDKEVILLAPIYFWAKSLRISQPGAADENIVWVVSDVLLNHPKRAELFPHLSDIEIRQFCRGFDTIIEYRKFALEAEGESMPEEEPDEFIFRAAGEALYGRGTPGALPKFIEIDNFRTRQAVIKAVVHEKLPGKISGLLSGEFV